MLESIKLTFIVELFGAFFELVELHNLHIKGERTYSVLEYGLILPSNS